MKIVAISDIHGLLPELPKCDVVTISGDIVPLHIQTKYEDCLAWLAGPFQNWALNLDCQKVIFIAGNHDYVFEYMSNEGEHKCNTGAQPSWKFGYDTIGTRMMLFQLDNPGNPKIVYLKDSSYVYNGVVFYGTPWCPNLKNWAFYKDSQGLTKAFMNIPEDTDVLLTHCPPKYMGQGLVHETNFNYMNDFGCVELQDALEFNFAMKDLWVLSGHIHSGKHSIEKYNNIKYRNVSLKGEDYEVNYEPFEFELQNK